MEPWDTSIRKFNQKRRKNACRLYDSKKPKVNENETWLSLLELISRARCLNISQLHHSPLFNSAVFVRIFVSLFCQLCAHVSVSQQQRLFKFVYLFKYYSKLWKIWWMKRWRMFANSNINTLKTPPKWKFSHSTRCFCCWFWRLDLDYESLGRA